MDDYITDLYSLAQTLQYGAMKDELIRDRIVVGIRDKKLSQKLQLIPKLTLQKAVEMVKQSERVKQQQEILRPESSEPVNVLAAQEQISNRGSDTKWRKCNRHHRHTEQCPATNQHCYRCSNMGHYARCCNVNKNAAGKKKLQVPKKCQ